MCVTAPEIFAGTATTSASVCASSVDSSPRCAATQPMEDTATSVTMDTSTVFFRDVFSPASFETETFCSSLASVGALGEAVDIEAPSATLGCLCQLWRPYLLWQPLVAIIHGEADFM